MKTTSRTSRPPWWVIGNPAAGQGRGERRLREVASALGARSNVVVKATTRAGDELELGAAAASAGAAAVIAVGGDGTWSKVANGLLSANSRPPLALIAGGTGNDFAKTLGAPARDIAATIALIESGSTRWVDAGLVEGRYFLVCCGFGFDTAVLQRMEASPLRGSSRYVAAALRELFTYKGFTAALDDAPSRELLMLVLANAQHYGGAFRIAPNALLDDGKLDAISVGRIPAWRRAGLFAAATSGRHVESTWVGAEQTSSIALTFPSPPLYNLDGDLARASSSVVRIACVPRVLEVYAPAV